MTLPLRDDRGIPDAPPAAGVASPDPAPPVPAGMRLVQGPVQTWAEVAVLLAAIWFWFGPRRGLFHLGSLTSAVASTGLFLLAVVVAVAVVGGSLGALGLRRERMGRHLRRGVVLVVPTYAAGGWAGILAAGLGIALGWDTVETVTSGKVSVLRGIAELNPWVTLPIALFVGLYEEIVFRGALLPRLALIVDRRLAVVVAALVFGLAHYVSQGWLGMVQTTVVGIVLGMVTLREQSLWPAIFCHASFDLLSFVLVRVLQPYIVRVVGG